MTKLNNTNHLKEERKPIEILSLYGDHYFNLLHHYTLHVMPVNIFYLGNINDTGHLLSKNNSGGRYLTTGGFKRLSWSAALKCVMLCATLIHLWSGTNILKCLLNST